MSSHHSVTGDRVVRVFVSSTFRDMHAERDELIKRAFPQIRKLCEDRGVTFSEVDLRWGITEEESQRGKVLPTCLAEIQRCRPYFIGLLGERYGWVPDAIPAELIEQEPWLAEHRTRSVTELEILHGVLNDRAMAEHAFFYFRDPAYSYSKSPEDQADYIEAPSTEEILSLGVSEAERRVRDRKDKLEALKDRIRTSRLPLRENYATPQALGELVLRDLSEIIERLYPPDEAPDPLNRDALDHEAFARSRARIYIGRKPYFDRLQRHAEGDGPPLVITGESGSGKSALLSNWALRYRETHPHQPLLMHFVGATAQSADWAAMLRRVLAEFKRTLGIEAAIPDSAGSLRSAFAGSLNQVAALGGAVLILDALNQLDDREGALDLTWLPAEIPPKIRLMLSTLPGRALDELNRRGWPTLEVEPLEAEERQKLITDYLGQYAKRLSAARVSRIVHAKQTANPLYLRALLDELRVFGVHEELDSRIDHYLAARTPAKLYQKILERYEQDYETERPRLVREAMSLLWSARRGLSETELLELLGSKDQPLPRAYWSPLYLAAEQSLVSRSGQLGFVHDFLRQAVHARYLHTKPQRVSCHRRLAEYFDWQFGPHNTVRLPAVDRRTIEELPWHLAESGEWRRLSALLTNKEFFHTAWEVAQYDLSAWWTRIEDGSSVRLIDAYQPWLDEGSSVTDTQILASASVLLSRAGHSEMANSFYIAFAKHMSEVSESAGMTYPAGLRADWMLAEGRYDEALRLYKEQELFCRKVGNYLTLQLMLGDQAEILIGRGEFDEALRLSREQEQICRDQGVTVEMNEAFKDGLARSLGHQAVIALRRGEFDRATSLTHEQERLCREADDAESLQSCIGAQAEIARARRDLDGALELLKKQERICRERGYKRSLAGCLGRQAEIARARGDVEEARRLGEHQERLGGAIGGKPAIAGVLNDRANDLFNRGQLDEAIELYRQCEVLALESGDQRSLADSLGHQAMVAYSAGDLADALVLYERAVARWRELDDRDGLQAVIGNYAVLLHAMDKPDESLRLSEEQERLCREIHNNYSLQQSLGNQAVILRAKGQLDRAGKLYEEQERICRYLDYKPGLAYALINQASLLANERNLPKEGLPLAEAALNLARENDLVLLVEQFGPVVDFVRRKAATSSSPVHISTAHPNANAERAARLNLEYQRELAQWKALPWVKRVRTKKPEPPRGI